ncbi:unnamed protein product [Arabidopsis thaliana]|uniref:(thale cress) hypothetical protein n=1 Tax=Arabidopsis thaliana TaxID=3702 RepID=A0A7G2F6J9_ARATH|nr:unnamed protein product [Arabidopsis thaliana]
MNYHQSILCDATSCLIVNKNGKASHELCALEIWCGANYLSFDGE